MHTDYPTKLSMRDFCQIIGINPLHVGGIDTQTIPNIRGQLCAGPYMQYPYQDADRVSRSEIAQAILEAETLIETQLRFRLLPSWERQEFHQYSDALKLPRVAGLQTRWGHVIAGGSRAVELLGTPAVVWSDVDGDGYKETGTLTINGLTDQLPNGTCEVRIYHPGHDAEPAWEIKPLRVARLTAGTLTVTFWRETAVKPELYEQLVPQPIIWDTDAQFLATVDVYREWNDTAQAQQLLWSSLHGGCVAGPDFATWNEQDANLLATNPRLGQVQLRPALWSDTDLVWSSRSWSSPYPLEAVNLYYYAGYQDKGQSCGARDMDIRFKNAVAVLAASMLDRPPCDCTADQWHYYREDLALDDGSEDFGTFRTPTGVLDNPFGTRRGAVMAWRRVKDPGVRVGAGVAAS